MTFMLFDIIHVSLSAFIWFIVSSAQGFVLGWLSNVLSFRSCSALKKLSLAVLLSSSLMPCLYYLLGRIGGIRSLIALNLLFCVALFAILFQEKRRLPGAFHRVLSELRTHKFFILANLIWLLFGLIMLIDIQVGKKLYLSMTMFDHSAKIAIADSILRTGLPPVNPFFFPGEPVPLFYHYFWPISCSVISTMSGSPYDSRVAVIAGVLWTGVVFLSGVRVCSSYFACQPADSRKVAFFTIMLLMVSNLYILPTLPINYFGMGLLQLPSLCWWTVDQIPPIVYSMLWVPHYVASLIAGMFGSILLLQSSRVNKAEDKIWHAMLASVCGASSCGLSLFCAIGIAFGWLAWGLYSLWRKRVKDAIAVVVVGLTGLALSSLFLNEMAKANSNPMHLPFAFAVRRFELVNGLISCWPDAYQQLFYFLVLPVNLLFGLGFISIGAFLFWREKMRFSISPVETREEFLLVMVGSSILLSSFIRSTILGNDLGKGVIMLSTFVLLLWSGQFLAKLYERKKRIELSAFNWVVIVLGVSSFFYSVYLDRTAARSLTRGERAYEARLIYQELNKRLPPNIVIQYNPDSHLIDLVSPCLGLYSHHQAAASDYLYGLTMGGDRKKYFEVAKEITRLFKNLSATEASKICRRYKIDVIVVSETDPIWSMKSSWIWKVPAIAACKHVRAYLVTEGSLSRYLGANFSK